ncbi:unnamed protein product, partial [Choristocarpus tenellus]
EWTVLFQNCVASFVPLSNKASWVLPLTDILKVSDLSDERCPFPGLRGIRLETVGKVHYLCLASLKTRDLWRCELERLIGVGSDDLPSSDLYLGLDPRDPYDLKTNRWQHPTDRLVLNARRLNFDLPSVPCPDHKTVEGLLDKGQHQAQPWQIAAKALRVAFNLTRGSNSRRLIPFLDLTSLLRQVDLGALDLDSNEALCFFVNLYHLMIRHMVLVLGLPPSPKEWCSWTIQVSYEIGGDVFSLNELEHCVLRGALPRPSPKALPKRFPPLPPEDDHHYVFKLGKADEHLCMVLNNGSLSNPPVVVLLTPESLEEQMFMACQAFVEHTVKVYL